MWEQEVPDLVAMKICEACELMEQNTGKQPIRTRYFGHVTGYQPIRDQYSLIRSVPAVSFHVLVE